MAGHGALPSTAVASPSEVFKGKHMPCHYTGFFMYPATLFSLSVLLAHPTTPQTAEAAVGQTGRALLQEAAVREEGAAQDEGIDPVHPLWGQREDKQIQVGGGRGGGAAVGGLGCHMARTHLSVLHVEAHVESNFLPRVEAVPCTVAPLVAWPGAPSVSLGAVAAGDGVCGCCLHGGAAAAAGGGAGGAGGEERKAWCAHW